MVPKSLYAATPEPIAQEIKRTECSREPGSGLHLDLISVVFFRFDFCGLHLDLIFVVFFRFDFCGLHLDLIFVVLI